MVYSTVKQHETEQKQPTNLFFFSFSSIKGVHNWIYKYMKKLYCIGNSVSYIETYVGMWVLGYGEFGFN